MQYMIEALGVLDVQLEQDRPARKLVVHGCNGRFASQGAELYLGNAGTAMRSAHLPDFEVMQACFFGSIKHPHHALQHSW